MPKLGPAGGMFLVKKAILEQYLQIGSKLTEKPLVAETPLGASSRAPNGKKNMTKVSLVSKGFCRHRSFTQVTTRDVKGTSSLSCSRKLKHYSSFQKRV